MKTIFCLFIFIIPFILVPIHSQAQRINISGRVIDSSSLIPLNRISVVDKHSGIGTMTSDDGYYSIFLQKGLVELEYSGMNYESQKAIFVLQNDTVVDVKVNLVFQDKNRRMKRDSGIIVQSDPLNKPDNLPQRK